jgi:phage terminase large subunit
MSFAATTATHKVIKLRKRIRLLSGGTSASKTISILLYLIDKAQSDKKPTLTSVVSESFPHLKRGSMRDFLNILQEHDYYDENRWNKTESTYTFETSSKLEFFSADMPSKVRGPRRDRLFVNEANNVAKESWDQLLLRTREIAFADWNPTSDFYMYEDYDLRDEGEVGSSDPNVDFLILTYKDNEALDESIVQEIEKRRANVGWWRVYGEGKRGEVEGKIFINWKIIDEIPHEARLVRYGLDFGYSNDPTAIVAIYYYNGGYILDEITYQKGLSNKQIADILNNQPKCMVMADSAEPKSIDELMLYGVNVQPTLKGQGSVNQGIQYVQDQQISITKRSVHGIKEYRNYMWDTDKEGRILNDPIDLWNHFMDATRYGFESLRPKEKHKPVKRERLKMHL